MPADIRLLRLGHIEYAGPYAFVEHRHDFLQLSYVLRGSALVSLNGQVRPLRQGQAHFCHPDWRHVIWASPDMGLELIEVRFHAANEEALAATLAVPPFLTSGNGAVVELIKHIEREGIARQPLWLEVAQAYLIQLIAHALRDVGGPPEDASLVTRAITKMRDSLPRGMPMGRLAEELHVSPSHLTALFKAQVGKTPRQFITDLKLDEVKHQLVLSTRPDVSRLARRYGWSDESSFRRMFRAATGKSPTDFASQYVELRAAPDTTENWVVFSEDIPMVWQP